jgi:hypothetical protein
MAERAIIEAERLLNLEAFELYYAALHAETRTLIEAGDIDGMAAALRNDARGLAEQMTDYRQVRS